MASPTDSGSRRSASLGRIALTDRTVRALKPPNTGRLDVWDEDNPGFGLRISAEGRRTWILMGKKLRRLTLGRFPTLGLAAAREKATDALRDAAKGQDPGRRKIEERRAETFAELAREYIERHASKKRSGREDVRLLNGSPHKKKTGKKPHVPLVTRCGGDPIRWTVDLSGFVLRSSSSEKKMIDVGAVGISRSLRDFQTPVSAFCASTGVAASTSSSTFAKSFNGMITSGTMRALENGDTDVAAPLEKIAPGAS
jgi:hypothetical protein